MCESDETGAAEPRDSSGTQCGSIVGERSPVFCAMFLRKGRYMNGVRHAKGDTQSDCCNASLNRCGNLSKNGHRTHILKVTLLGLGIVPT